MIERTATNVDDHGGEPDALTPFARTPAAASGELRWWRGSPPRVPPLCHARSLSHRLGGDWDARVEGGGVVRVHVRRLNCSPPRRRGWRHEQPPGGRSSCSSRRLLPPPGQPCSHPRGLSPEPAPRRRNAALRDSLRPPGAPPKAQHRIPPGRCALLRQRWGLAGQEGGEGDTRRSPHLLLGFPLNQLCRRPRSRPSSRPSAQRWSWASVSPTSTRLCCWRRPWPRGLCSRTCPSGLHCASPPRQRPPSPASRRTSGFHTWPCGRVGSRPRLGGRRRRGPR
mmetsp:Transcript_12713/g.40160  ORF Transcript_12713/g.40160 Transcript_12713/m.40160 type:complete len:281 (+) Transcript_12713:337-1179(+)